jgi:hypothetical protein
LLVICSGGCTTDMDHNPMDTYGFLRSVVTVTLEYRGYVMIRAEGLHKWQPSVLRGYATNFYLL